MTDLIKFWTTQLAALIEATGALIICIASIETALRAMSLFVRRGLPADAKESVRLRLGAWLSVALEFELAADILRTAIAPSWNDVGLLAAIIGLRTILNFFLQLEIDKARLRAMLPLSAMADERTRERIGETIDMTRPFAGQEVSHVHASM